MTPDASIQADPSRILHNPAAQSWMEELDSPRMACLGKKGRISMARLTNHVIEQVTGHYLADLALLVRCQRDVTGLGETDMDGFRAALTDLLGDCITDPVETEAEAWERRHG